MLRRREKEIQQFRKLSRMYVENIVSQIPNYIKDYTTIEDFAPEWCKPGSKVVDPETGLKGEVIGYDERLVVLPTGGE